MDGLEPNFTQLVPDCKSIHKSVYPASRTGKHSFSQSQSGNRRVFLAQLFPPQFFFSFLLSNR